MNRRGNAASFVIKVAITITGRWMTIREVVAKLDLPLDKTDGASYKKVRRSMDTIEMAGLPLQVDEDETDERSVKYYRLPAGWNR